jgi:hypothetical protein
MSSNASNRVKHRRVELIVVSAAHPTIRSLGPGDGGQPEVPRVSIRSAADIPPLNNEIPPMETDSLLST